MKRVRSNPFQRLTGSRPSGQRVKAIVNPITGMNKTEAAYSETLEAKRLAGEILEWKFEPIKFKLADLTFYTPDFAVQLPDGTLEFVDVKGRLGEGAGGMEGDAYIKLKMVAKLYPWFRFVAASKTKQGFVRQEF